MSTYRDRAITLPKGTEFKRISREAFADYTNTGSAYVSYRLRDTAKYVSASSNKFAFPGGSRNYLHTLKSNDTVKVPSARTMARIYLKQHPNATDQQFRSMITYGFVQWDSDAKNDPIISSFKKQASDFRKALLKEGYNAIIDIEDAGKEIQAPLILMTPNTYTTGSSQIKTYERVAANLMKRNL